MAEQTWRASPATCWQISTEIPHGASCVALPDSQSTHARHAERAGWLRGALGEAGGLVWCCSLACAAIRTAEVEKRSRRIYKRPSESRS